MRTSFDDSVWNCISRFNVTYLSLKCERQGGKIKRVVNLKSEKKGENGLQSRVRQRLSLVEVQKVRRRKSCDLGLQQKMVYTRSSHLGPLVNISLVG